MDGPCAAADILTMIFKTLEEFDKLQSTRRYVSIAHDPFSRECSVNHLGIPLTLLPLSLHTVGEHDDETPLQFAFKHRLSGRRGHGHTNAGDLLYLDYSRLASAFTCSPTERSSN